ncbi:unnamed protein product [Rotaria sp. Silwood2]|nr:unnamed protein product [Rotaria sp. Silwood2]CAF2924949.1 unnamed protein product [Rotaria sp. Silwood2]CAF4019620.1 unnamed protein product [Rotaria sp. Silwood2]CAF4023603.1 unnamed protein product [Rotaria sp. Silwood2]
MERLRNTSIYLRNIESIVNNLELFEYYYHDQLAILLDEVRMLTIQDKLKHFLMYQDELIELLYLFEIDMELIGEEKWNFDVQFCISDNTQLTMTDNSSNLYILVQIEQQFYQVPSQQLLNNKSYECVGDPFIETSLMNLIDLLLSSSTIDRIDNVAQLSTAYSLTVQDVLALYHYLVTNLEKMGSIDSFVRCIMSLLLNDRILTCLTNEDMIERYLNDYYDYFRENIYSYKTDHELSMIVSIAWLTLYIEIYEFSLSTDNHINKLLTRN